MRQPKAGQATMNHPDWQLVTHDHNVAVWGLTGNFDNALNHSIGNCLEWLTPTWAKRVAQVKVKVRSQNDVPKPESSALKNIGRLDKSAVGLWLDVECRLNWLG
jgi:hypothetical protein